MNKTMKNTVKKPKTVELVRTTYRPTKSEINQEFEVDLPENVDEAMDELGKAMMQTVRFRRNRQAQDPP